MRYFILLAILFLLPLDAFAQSHNGNLPVEITADSMEIMQKKNLAIFKGSVQANQDNLNIRSDKMTVYYKRAKNKDQQSSVSKVEIDGNVFISTPKETAQGEKGLFNVEEKIITLDGNVTLTSGKSVVNGDNLVYNLKTGESKIKSGKSDMSETSGKKGRVKGVFIPQGN